MKENTLQDQIDYLEAYSKMLKTQAEMVDMQIKFLKSGKDMQENFQKMFPMLNMLDWSKFQ